MNELSNQGNQWSAEMKRFVVDTIMPGASDQELIAFMHVARGTGLDPVKRQIYAVSRWNEKLKRYQWTTQCSIDGFRAIAESTNDYEGQVGPFWCGPDGLWKDVWISVNPPSAAKVGVWRKGFREPLYRIALYSEYVQKKNDGEVTKFWRSMPALMLAKCAESLALRGAFPQKLSGLYTDDEMSQAVEVEQERLAPVASNTTQTITHKVDVLRGSGDASQSAQPLPYVTTQAVAAPSVVVRPKANEVTQSQPAAIPAPVEGLGTLIARAASGGPIGARSYAEAIGISPPYVNCMTFQIPLGKHKNKMLVEVEEKDLRNLAEYFVREHRDGKPLSKGAKDTVSAIQDFLDSKEGIEHDAPRFESFNPETMGTSMGGT